MKKVYIYAYLRNNVGDDLFVNLVLKKYPNSMFYIWNDPRYLNPFKKNKNVVVPNRFSFFLNKVFRRVLKAEIGPLEKRQVKKADVILKIGGSVFMETENYSYRRIYRGKHAKPLYVLGANFGPYKTKDYLNAVCAELSGCIDVCFRDRYSYNLFNKLPRVRYAPDILFQYTLPESIERKNVGISLVDVDRKPGLSIVAEDYVRIIGNAIRIMVKEGYRVKLFGFCIGEGDSTIINALWNIMGSHDSIDRIDYDGNNLDLFLSEFCRCEYIVASRFHSMILGWNAGKKVLPVIYNQKTRNVISDVEYDGPVWDLFEKNNPSEKQIVNWLFESKPLKNVDKLKEESKKQFAVFEKEVN